MSRMANCTHRPLSLHASPAPDVAPCVIAPCMIARCVIAPSVIERVGRRRTDARRAAHPEAVDGTSPEGTNGTVRGGPRTGCLTAAGGGTCATAWGPRGSRRAERTGSRVPDASGRPERRFRSAEVVPTDLVVHAARGDAEQPRGARLVAVRRPQRPLHHRPLARRHRAREVPVVRGRPLRGRPLGGRPLSLRRRAAGRVAAPSAASLHASCRHTSGGRSPSVSGPSPSWCTSARRTRFSTCRTLPGRSRHASASTNSRSTSAPRPAAGPRYRRAKCSTSGAMSSRRSRRAGACSRQHVEAVIEVGAERPRQRPARGDWRWSRRSRARSPPTSWSSLRRRARGPPGARAGAWPGGRRRALPDLVEEQHAAVRAAHQPLPDRARRP